MQKLYLPTEYINNDYNYYISNEYTISVRTNQNCYTQYSTIYCDCFDIFTNLDYIKSNTYSCSVSSYAHTLSNNILTDDLWYNLNITKSLFMFVIFAIIIIIIPYKIWSRLFGRWFKI